MFLSDARINYGYYEILTEKSVFSISEFNLLINFNCIVCRVRIRIYLKLIRLAI